MASIGPITLYREKSVIHRFDGQSGSDVPQDPSFVLKSNRLTMEVSAHSHTAPIVVRGHNIAGTLRMAAIVAERFTRDPETFSPHNPYPPDWGDLWERKVSGYERQFNRDNWTSLHVGGATIFTTRDSPPVVAIERLAQGADLDERTVRQAVASVFGCSADSDMVVQHDSQTAVVVTPFSAYLRAAILERKSGRTGSFSVSVYHTETRRARTSSLLNFCADLIESYNLRQFLERAPGASDVGATAPAHLRQQIDAVVKRRRELAQYIEGFEHANRVQYRPERPDL
ncbi:hypothetical protein [Roseospira goensis]|uniref:Uncharacterized protein n=1 Tax=Roseospira goensis TaxID=391922 RepID=A0A7W6RX62_9PROT|nr:hypothetical protein [Roseospira goensis]MBB4284812.1 hypothetical protein [Roseospira goensis]